MAYKAPVWEDGKAPAISAENLNALSQAVEGAQVLYGNSAPTSSTEGAVGQFYLVVVADSDGNYPLYQCVAIANGSYTWKNLMEIPSLVAAALGLSSPATIFDALGALSTSGIACLRSAAITESANWTVPNDVANNKVFVICVGGGGGGGGGGGSSSYPTGGGGGGSGYVTISAVDVSPGEIIPIAIGAGGSGGASGSGDSTATGKNGTSGYFQFLLLCKFRCESQKYREYAYWIYKCKE